MKFIVHLPRYDDPNSGGIISLYRLLELLVELGYDSYVLPGRLIEKIRKRNEKKPLSHFGFMPLEVFLNLAKR